MIDYYDNHIIINVEDQYIKQVNIGKFIVCEIPKEFNIPCLKSLNKNIFLYNGKIFMHLKNKKSFTIEIESLTKNVWLCNIIIDEKLHELTQKVYKSEDYSFETVPIIYGRCVDSMTFLDKVYRDYVYKHKFKDGDILAIKSVAGSGKTTTLLELAKKHKTKKILYIAFNKSLITEIRSKIREKNIVNLYPVTFDALMRDVYINKKNIDPDEMDIFDLKPQTLPNIIQWFRNKPYRIKSFYVNCYNKFCNQTEYSDIKLFSHKKLGGEKKLLTNMWEKSLNGDLITFDCIRKMVEINHWCKDYIDSKYDMIFIDESQDFDNAMLKILLEDTQIPKVFVGDPRQAIYEWKGCINAFDKLPSHTLMLEFYSTFRVGDPACEDIRGKFNNCWMISKSSNVTQILYNVIPEEKYVYLFRSWKNLLQNARLLKDIFINNFDSQIEYIKKLHAKMQISNLDEEELNDFSDDLPKFLLKLSLEELEKLINDIERNIVRKEDAVIELYTVHSYKGLESEIVRIYNDIDVKKEENIYYVALTRGMKQIILDTATLNNEIVKENKKQMNLMKYGINAIVLA
jgi:ATP-dependent exoDNAse (exonuclease V) beta subunit